MVTVDLWNVNKISVSSINERGCSVIFYVQQYQTKDKLFMLHSLHIHTIYVPWNGIFINMNNSIVIIYCTLG